MTEVFKLFGTSNRNVSAKRKTKACVCNIQSVCSKNTSWQFVFSAFLQRS